MRLIVEHDDGWGGPPRLVGTIELTPEGLRVEPHVSAAECVPEEVEPGEAEEHGRTAEQLRAGALYRRRHILNRILRRGGYPERPGADVLRWLAEHQPDVFDLRLEDDDRPLPAARQAP